MPSGNGCSPLSCFRDKLEARVAASNSLLCIGLDPHVTEVFGSREISAESITEEERADASFTFCQTLIDATAPYAASFKPNAAFFEAIGPNHGMKCLQRVIAAIPRDIPVLLDVKRGDIGSTSAAYAEACYDQYGADAVTLSPLMGWDSILPFVSGKYENRGVFVLCKTSNSGSQDVLALTLQSGESLFERIAHLVGHTWSHQAPSSSLLGLVVGATDPVALQQARAQAGPECWILAPGVGTQGGDVTEACLCGLNDQATCMLIPVSRAISQSEDPAAAAKALWEQTQMARDRVRQCRFPKATGSGEHLLKRRALEPHQREFLNFLLEQGVLKFGSFTLKSGRISPYFFDAGLLSTGSALYKLGLAYARSIMASAELTDLKSKAVKFDVIFGPAYKGISLGAVVSAALYSAFRIDVGFAYNRKEVKTHGEGGVLVGSSMGRKRVLIIDDVITAGTAIRESMDLLSRIEAQPVGVIIALDRAEIRSTDDRISAVQAITRDFQLPVVAIVSLPELQSFLETIRSFSDETLKNVTAYREQYGI